MNQRQEKGSIIPVPVSKPEISPKMGQQDLTPKQDTIPITDMILAPEQELIGINLIAEYQNPNIMINRTHSPEHNPTLLLDALAADLILVIRTRRPYKK